MAPSSSHFKTCSKPYHTLVCFPLEPRFSYMVCFYLEFLIACLLFLLLLLLLFIKQRNVCCLYYIPVSLNFLFICWIGFTLLEACSLPDLINFLLDHCLQFIILHHITSSLFLPYVSFWYPQVLLSSQPLDSRVTQILVLSLLFTLCFPLSNLIMSLPLNNICILKIPNIYIYLLFYGSSIWIVFKKNQSFTTLRL